MNRRDFMRRMFGTAVTVAVPNIFIPKTAYGKLYGIPEALNDGAYGTWMGIKRASHSTWAARVPVQNGMIRQDLIIAIKKMMDNALEKNWEIILGNDKQMDYFKKII